MEMSQLYHHGLLCFLLDNWLFRIYCRTFASNPNAVSYQLCDLVQIS